MSGYSDYYKDQQHAEFLRRWAPKDGYPDDWNGTTRWHYARAQAAETELRELKSALSTVVRAGAGGTPRTY